MEDMKELSLSEMEGISGGGGGFAVPREKEGCACYQIQPGDSLEKIAKKYGTTAEYLHSINPTIFNIRDITVGYYIFVPI